MIPGHQIPMEPTDNLSGGHSPSWDYGCPAAATFDRQEQEEDPISSLFVLPDSAPPSLWPLSPAEGFAAAPENFGDVQISPLDEMPCLVDTHGTGTGQLSSNFSLSSTTSNEFDEEEVQQAMMSWQHFVHPPMAPDGLSNTTNGGPAARRHADAVPVLQQGTSTTADELPHPQQRLPLPTNDPDPEAQPGGGWAWPDLSLADKEVQIQQMRPTISPSQPPSPAPVINPGPDEANHAASAPMGSQETLIPAAPQDQEANILSRASTRRRANKSRGLPSRLQDVSVNLYRMGIYMIQQLGRRIGKMRKDEQHRSSIVWQHFWRTSPCKYCDTVTVICPYCHTVMRDPSTIEMLRHLESIHQLPASSGARSSQALQIKEIAENPNGESEPIETDNSNNCATAARVDTQGTNAVALSPWQQHQPLMDREEQMATILSSQPCCRGPSGGCVVRTKYFPIREPDSWCDLIIRLSDSSHCSSTTKSPHDGFRLKFYDNSKVKVYKGVSLARCSSYLLVGVKNLDSASAPAGCAYPRLSMHRVPGSKILPQQQRVQVRSSAAWMHVSENPYEDHAGVSLATGSDTIGSSYLLVGVNNWDSSAPAGFEYPWCSMYRVICSLGFKKEFARDLVIYASGRVDGCSLRLMSPSSSNKGKSIVKQAGDVPSGKRKRKPFPKRSKVWKHFTEEVVEAEGSKVTMAKCDHCGSKLKADSKKHGTSQLERHITSTHPDELAKSPL